MEDNRKITIEILSGSGSSSVSSKKEEVDEEYSNTIKQILHPIKSVEASTIGKSVIINQAYQNAKQLASQSINYSFKRYTTLKEDYILENNLNNFQLGISKVKGFAGAAFSGAVMGSSLGPIGSVFGAAVSLGGYGITNIIQNSAYRSSYYQDLNATNLQTQFMQQRSSLYNEGRGTEN